MATHSKMIDFYIKEKICPDEVKVILSGLFRCTSDKILVLPLEEFNEIILLKQGFDEMVCLCTYIETNGDAALLLQLYRYEMSDDDLLKNLVNFSRNSHFSFYFPFDDFDGWIWIQDGHTHVGKELETEKERCFLFSR